jgi:hypothetical protein
MSPSRLLSTSTFNITLLDKVPGKKHNYGATITDLDLNDIDGKLSIKIVVLTR